MQGQQSPDEQPPHGVGVWGGLRTVIILGGPVPCHRPGRQSRWLWPGAVYAREGQPRGPQSFPVLFGPSSILLAARPEGDGRAERKRKAALSDSGRLPPREPQLRLRLPGGEASAARPGRWPGSAMKGQLQETSSRGHVARPPPAPRPLVGSSRRTQSPSFPAPGPGGQSGAAERGGRRGRGASFRDAGFGGRGVHRGPNLPGAEVFFSLTLQAASAGAEPPRSAPLPRRSIRELSVPPRGALGPRAPSARHPGGQQTLRVPRPGAQPPAPTSAPAARRRGRLLGSVSRAVAAGARARSLLPPPGGWRPAVLPSAAPWPELPARRSENPAGSPGSGGAAPPLTPGARQPPRLGEQRPRRPPRRLGRPADSRLGSRGHRSPSPPPPFPGLGVRRTAPACAEPELPELRGQREPGTSAAEAEAATRRGGPSATQWPRLESSLRAGRRGGGPEPGPGASPANTFRLRGRGRLASPGPAGGQHCQPLTIRRTGAHRAPPLCPSPPSCTPLTKASSGSRSPRSQEPQHPSPTE